jgi:hypothetical protein
MEGRVLTTLFRVLYSFAGEIRRTYMKKYVSGLVCLLAVGLVAAGCRVDEVSSADQQAQQPAANTGQAAAQGSALAQQPGDAAGPNSQRGETFTRLNQLAIGTLYLQSTNQPITVDQAATLLPLWQSLQSLMQPTQTTDAANSTPGTPADETAIAAALDSIEAAFTAEQKTLLEAQTQEQLQTWAQEQGLMGAGGQGMPDGTPGAGGPNGNGQGALPANGTPGAGGPGGGQGGAPANGTPPADFTPGANGAFPGGGGRGGFGSPLIEAVITMLQGL